MNRMKELEICINTPDQTVENRYTLRYPTIQQMIDIESMKISLSKGKYTDMILAGTKWMDRALNYIDLVAYFSVLCPNLLRDMKVDIRNISVIDAHDSLLKVYFDDFLPWWSEYESLISDLEKRDKEDDGQE